MVPRGLTCFGALKICHPTPYPHTWKSFASQMIFKCWLGGRAGMYENCRLKGSLLQTNTWLKKKTFMWWGHHAIPLAVDLKTARKLGGKVLWLWKTSIVHLTMIAVLLTYCKGLGGGDTVQFTILVNEWRAYMHTNKRSDLGRLVHFCAPAQLSPKGQAAQTCFTTYLQPSQATARDLHQPRTH